MSLVIAGSGKKECNTNKDHKKYKSEREKYLFHLGLILLTEAGIKKPW
jgi:hypothetical protein